MANATPAADALLDRALDLPQVERARFLAEACVGDPLLRERLERLLALATRADGFLDRSPLAADDAAAAASDGATAAPPSAAPPTLAAGHRFGAFELVRPLGRGGMGEVWLGERVEGGFAQTVAIKCLHAESPAALVRFDAERAILASLEHPNVARLYDGGVTPDGRAFMVMEYVDGTDLLAWCAARGSGLRERLELFLAACDAVAYAHTRLVVHRDLKPANVLVTPAGVVKLLDFGVAKLLEPGLAGDRTATVQLSAAYAAPEQLMGGAVGTATDVHALGATLYQLLTGRLPWDLTGLPIGAAVHRLLAQTPRPASAVVGAGGPVTARELRGDLDAILARALRQEPGERYPDARALADDVRRVLRFEPVQARSGARAYVARRFVRRHWLPLAATLAAFALLATATLAVAWQATRAEQAALRATAMRDYLVRVFEASDPRVASDRPRAEITARELLDAATARIERDFAGRAELQVELLGMTAGIYRALGEQERYADLHARHVELARRHLGPLHPTVLEAQLREADDAVLHQDYAAAAGIVATLDPLVRRAGLERSVVRAKWWLRRANSLEADLPRIDERLSALHEAVRLFERHGPLDPDHVVALANLAVAYYESDRPDGPRLARDFARRAVTVAEEAQARGQARDDGELVVMYANLGHVEILAGDLAAGDAALERSLQLAARTYGERDRRWWNAASTHASSLHGRGERERAAALFARVLAALPTEPALAEQDAVALVLTRYGTALLREGRPVEALDVLERARAGYERAHRGGRFAYLNRSLGETYEALGRPRDARRHLERSLAEVRQEGSEQGSSVLAARERLARFLLGEGEFAAAGAEYGALRGLVAPDDTRLAALVEAGLARVALAADRPGEALEASTRALALHAAAGPAPEVRLHPQLLLVHARALAASGALAEARAHARRAAEALERYNAPGCAERARARALVAELEAQASPSAS